MVQSNTNNTTTTTTPTAIKTNSKGKDEAISDDSESEATEPLPTHLLDNVCLLFKCQLKLIGCVR